MKRGTRLLWMASVLLSASLSVVACGSNGAEINDTDLETRPAPTVPANPAPTATASPEDEIVSTYLRYWDAYSLAVLNLDPAAVTGVAAGEELAGIEDEIDELRSLNLAVRTVVQHNPIVIRVSNEDAVLEDTMTNNSFYVDPVTKNPPVASGSGEILRDTYYFEKVDGKWTVVRSVRQR